MSPRAACRAEIVQATRDHHDNIGKAVFRVAQLVFGNPANFDASNRVLGTDTCARQFAIMAFLAWR